MNAKAKNILVGAAICLGSGLLAVASISISSAANTDNVSSEQTVALNASADRFASNANFCKAFTGAKEVGSDGVSAEFSAAMGDAIHANGGNVKHTFSTIRAKCTSMA